MRKENLSKSKRLIDNTWIPERWKQLYYGEANNTDSLLLPDNEDVAAYKNRQMWSEGLSPQERFFLDLLQKSPRFLQRK